MISAGEVHLPGRPKDIVGLKALAITAQRAFHNFRPGGVKVLAGAPVIETGHGRIRLPGAGRRPASRCWARSGLGSVKAGAEARQMVAWARKHGIQSTIHTGGPSIPGSGLDRQGRGAGSRRRRHRPHQRRPHRAARGARVRAVRALVTRHRDRAQRQREGRPSPPCTRARDRKCLHRVILGHRRAGRLGRAAAGDPADDRAAVEPGRHPGRAGVLLRHRQHGAHSRARLRADRTGARRPISCSWIGLSTRPARRLLESVALGDIPGVGMVVIDGIVRCQRSRNTPPATEVPVLWLPGISAYPRDESGC